MKDSQSFVKRFAEDNGWKNTPDIDKFDHLHEELIEMSKHLRYKDAQERKKIAAEKKDVFVDGIGDLYFALCRLANQLNIDIEDAFNDVREKITEKYADKPEWKPG